MEGAKNSLMGGGKSRWSPLDNSPMYNTDGKRKKYGDRKESANKVSKEAREEHRSQVQKRTKPIVGPGSGPGPGRRSKEERASDKQAWKDARAAKKAFKKDPSPENRAALKTAKRRKAQVKQKSAERAYRRFM